MKALKVSFLKFKGGEKMNYKIIGYRKRRKLGSLKDHKGEVFVFRTKEEAITTANIESTQMENIGVQFKVVPTKLKIPKR